MITTKTYNRWYDEHEGIIRSMLESDVDACIQMTIDSFKEEYPLEQFETIREEFMSSFKPDWWGRPKYFVYDFKGEILGMGGYQISPLDWDIFEFFWLCVKKKFQGKGIGKKLVEFREKEILKDYHFKSDVTILFSCTKSVIKYHKKHGYNVILKKNLVKKF